MSIPLRNTRRKRRRSYADYPPKRRKPSGPRSDPFRVILYLVLIAGCVWVYFNQETARSFMANTLRGPQPAATQQADSSTAPELEAASQQAASAEELAAQAEGFYREGQLVEAVALYEQAAELSPNTIDYYVQAARLYLFQAAMQYGDSREETLALAAKAAERAILADPFSPEGYAISGKVQDWQGDAEQALSTIRRALEINERYPLAQSYYAEALIDLARWDQARESIQFALELAPDHVDVRRDYAYILESLADYNAAATQYEAALALHPNLPFLRMALARSYRQLERYDEALDIFFEVQVVQPNNALIPYEIGRTYETYIGDPNSALEYFQQAVTLDENFSTPWIRIGTIRYLQGSYNQAIPSYERAIELGVENADLYLQLGMSYALEGQCGQAVRNLQEAQNRAEGDQRILDIAAEGFTICEQPTPVPVDVLGTPTVQPTP